MRSFVLKSVAVTAAVVISFSNAYSQSCRCKPDPPGGGVDCTSGIAVCGRGPGGGCQSRCAGATGTTSLEIAASSLSSVLGGSITADDLRRNREEARGAISALLGSGGNTEVTITFEGRSLSGTVALSTDVAESLRDALSSLTSDVEVQVEDAHKNIPELPANVPAAELERHRRKLEQYRKELEEQRKSKEVSIETYKEGIDKYKDAIKEYKDTVRPPRQDPPDTLNE